MVGQLLHLLHVEWHVRRPGAQREPLSIGLTPEVGQLLRVLRVEWHVIHGEVAQLLLLSGVNDTSCRFNNCSFHSFSHHFLTYKRRKLHWYI